MGFRFRKSVNVGGVRVNFSKSGVGYSVGTKGARITKTANGRTRTTAGIPGTGISYVSETSSKSKNSSVSAQNIEVKKSSMAIGVSYRVFSIPLILLGLLLALAIHPACWGFVAFGVLLWMLGGRKIKQAKRDRNAEKTTF